MIFTKNFLYSKIRLEQVLDICSVSQKIVKSKIANKEHYLLK